MNKKQFNKEKRTLRMYFKQLKAKIIKWEDVPAHYQFLLTRYYGIKKEKEEQATNLR